MTRVVLVDDHDLFRAGVRAQLGEGVEIVGEAANVADAVQLIKQLDPDVVLLDVHLEDGSGDAVFSPRLAGFVLDAFRTGEPIGADEELETLTPREREVLQLIARGYLYKEIAARLHLSVKTVEAHVSSVLRKLQLSSRHELTRWAHERRLI